TCLLCNFGQAVTISPSSSQWTWLKEILPKCMLPSCLLSWTLNMLINADMPVYATGPWNTSSQITYDLKYCSVTTVTVKIALINAIMYYVWDLLFWGLMSVASGYMIFVLQRHHRWVQHLHGPSHSPKAMPEIRAAKRVIALVTLYVLLYGRQTTIGLYTSYFDSYHSLDYCYLSLSIYVYIYLCFLFMSDHYI
uniref:Vomeronasal type-1 receptor n=1 Tax=Ornithorhynchus anatinus TaxID=9258 RepID=F7G2T5_ORNAN